jgi:hypothetical protein
MTSTDTFHCIKSAFTLKIGKTADHNPDHRNACGRHA